MSQGDQLAYSLASLTALNDEIAALVRAGVPLEGQLRRLGRELPGISGKLATRIGARMEGGASLSQALEAEKSLPDVYRAIVTAGQRSGRLAGALEALVTSANTLREMRRRTGAALVYPTLTIGLAWLLLSFVLLRVLPQLAWFEDLKGGPFTDFLTLPQLAAIAFTAVGTLILLAVIIWWWRAGSAAYHDQRLTAGVAWLPWWNRVRYLTNLAAYTEVLLLLVEQEVPFAEALRISADTVPRGPLKQAVNSLADGSELGRSKPSSLMGAQFPTLLAVALHHADDRRRLIPALRQAAAIYREQASQSALLFSELLPLFLTIAIGGLVALAFIVGLVWPYVRMLNELAGTGWW